MVPCRGKDRRRKLLKFEAVTAMKIKHDPHNIRKWPGVEWTGHSGDTCAAEPCGASPAACLSFFFKLPDKLIWKGCVRDVELLLLLTLIYN